MHLAGAFMSQSAALGLSCSDFGFAFWGMFAVVLAASMGDEGCVLAQSPAEHATARPAADAGGVAARRQASKNPVMRAGHDTPDGKLGAFRQGLTSDCFFLSVLIALAQDADGRTLLGSVVHKSTKPDAFDVVFPDQADERLVVEQSDLERYQLTDAWGKALTEPALGDPDVRILEIAGDKLWRKQGVKAEGLWDDVPMNAFSMFTNAKQQLIWNRARASPIARKDIDKYNRLPEGIVDEIQVTSAEQAEAALQAIVKSDTDGLSIVWCDYVRYHGLAILEIDFSKREFLYLDPGDTHELHVENLDCLFEGLVDGRFAINYLEVPD